jgi:beta-N-acetylhexosaminidase
MIVGVSGVEITPVERAWLRLLKPGGIILFRRNIESAEQTFKLLNETAGAGLRCIDVEGGTVNRLRDLVAEIPSADAVGRTGRRSLYERHGSLVGQAVRMLGFNATFAPVLDLGLPESRPVMQTRTASALPEVVAAYGEAFLSGLVKEDILGAGKHFPGLGGGTLDSHHALPLIQRSWEQIWEQDLLPYRKLIRKLPIVMVSHAAYPAITNDTVPASISPHWITEVLLRKLRYRGIVLSDDMEMGGVLSQVSIEDAVVRAVLSGTDIVEICHSPELIFRAYEALLSEAEKSRAFEARVRAAARKIALAKKELPAPIAKAGTTRRIEALREQLLKFSEAVNKADPA